MSKDPGSKPGAPRRATPREGKVDPGVDPVLCPKDPDSKPGALRRADP